MEEKHTSTDTISVSDIVYEGQAEQGIELDYILPDYYPEIFKILNCRLTPKILSYSLLGDSKMSVDGSVDITVTYLAEGSDAINCIEQHYTYSKTIDIGKAAVPDESAVAVLLSSKHDYCNCRAVSGRRIDVRGAVSTKVRITSQSSYSLPSIPDNIQLKNKEVTCCGSIISVQKQFTVREEIETGAQGISCILRGFATPKVNDIRIIADKAVVKGVITINAAYGLHDPDGQGCRVIERMSADIPVSQILDLDGIDEGYSGSAQISILNCELDCAADSGLIRCSILAQCTVTCRKEQTVKLPIDAFSTEYDTEYTTGKIKLTRSCRNIGRQISVKSSLSCDSSIETVLDCCAEIYNLSCVPKNENELSFTGQICSQALCRTTDGRICFIEKQEGFDCAIASENTNDNTAISFNAVCTDADYSIRSDGGLDINAKIELDGTICDNVSVPMLQSITIHEEKPKHKNSSCAMKICYAGGKDDCWSIAKRYSTPVSAIMAENDIEDESALLSGMVIIPAI